MRLHFHAGLLLAPFLLVAAITGIAYTTMPQVEQIVHREHLKVPVGKRALPLGEQVAAARRAHPEGTVTSIRPPVSRDGSTRVVLEVPGLEEGYSRTVFVDPYRAKALGALTTYGEWLPVRAWFDELHRTLHLGDTGRLYSELAASWLWVIALAGMSLWFMRRRRLRRSRNPSVRKPVGRKRLVKLHAGTGIVIAAGLLFLSATGLTWSKHAGENVTKLREQLSWQTPQVDAAASAEGGHEGHGGHAGHGNRVGSLDRATVDRTLASARRSGLDGSVELTPAAARGESWTVRQTKRSWPEKQDAVAVDPVSGQVTDRLAFADWPFAAKLARWGIDAHIGLLFGIVNQIVLALIAAGLIAMIVLGYRMWWRRRPAPTPGAVEGTRWWDLPLWILVPVTVVATVIGLLIPLLGITLLALLVLDTAIVLYRGSGRMSPAG